MIGVVEEADERRNASEHRQQLRIEAPAEREVGRILASADELLVPQVIGGRMVASGSRAARASAGRHRARRPPVETPVP